MKNITVVFMVVLTFVLTSAGLPLNPSGDNWEKVYRFDKCNVFQMEFYGRNHDLMKTINIKTWYQSNGENFVVVKVPAGRGDGSETIIDKKNEIAIQILGTGGGATPMYNAGGYKYPSAEDLKKLELTPTTETKIILGCNCKKYTYTYKKIFGEVWLTDRVTLPNDIGLFRACKMAALHNTLSETGFVMEMTTEDSNGGKTLMKTVALQTDEKYTIDLTNVQMTKAINKVNYFTF